MKNAMTLVGIVAALMCASPSMAIEPLSAAKLKEVCAGEQEDAVTTNMELCIFYVKGFLDGAVATDGRVAENVAAEIAGNETFTERAIRTRISNRLRDYGPSVYAKFCVGQPDPIEEVVTHVIDELEAAGRLDGIYAQAIVYRSLKRHYPCNVE